MSTRGAIHEYHGLKKVRYRNGKCARIRKRITTLPWLGFKQKVGFVVAIEDSWGREVSPGTVFITAESAEEWCDRNAGAPRID